MIKVRVRSYLSPTLVLLAFDWPDGAFREDFLGFAIEGGVPITPISAERNSATIWDETAQFLARKSDDLRRQG